MADKLSGWQLNVQTQRADSDGLESHQHTLQYHFMDNPSCSEPGRPISGTMLTLCKRPANDMANDSERNTKKSKRTCTYCSGAECKGRGGQRFCPKKGLDDQVSDHHLHLSLPAYDSLTRCFYWHQENLMEMTRRYNPWQIKHMQFLAVFGAYLGLLVENNNKE